MRRLNQHGHEAYLVGGAVRDLYLGKRPKDYDIATDATPTRPVSYTHLTLPTTPYV